MYIVSFMAGCSKTGLASVDSKLKTNVLKSLFVNLNFFEIFFISFSQLLKQIDALKLKAKTVGESLKQGWRWTSFEKLAPGMLISQRLPV